MKFLNEAIKLITFNISTRGQKVFRAGAIKAFNPDQDNTVTDILNETLCRGNVYKMKPVKDEIANARFFLNHNLRGSSMMRRSEMMDKLYGEAAAKKVFNRLEFLDHSLNEEIQKVAYDHYWALPGLSIRDKSLVTITSLMVLGKEEQTRIHLNGFLNSGGLIEEVMALLLYLGKKFTEESAKKGMLALIDVLKERECENDALLKWTAKFDTEISSINHSMPLNKHDLHIAEISSTVASGKLDKIDESIANYLDSHDGDYEIIRHIMIHQIVYCGFPATMNGFARLRHVLELKHAPEATRARL